MPMTPENATWFADAFSTIVNNVGQALLDKEDVIKLALTTMLSEGHLLLEDAPGSPRSGDVPYQRADLTALKASGYTPGEDLATALTELYSGGS